MTSMGIARVRFLDGMNMKIKVDRVPLADHNLSAGHLVQQLRKHVPWTEPIEKDGQVFVRVPVGYLIIGIHEEYLERFMKEYEEKLQGGAQCSKSG